MGNDGRIYFFGDARDPDGSGAADHRGHQLYEPGDYAIGVETVSGERTWGPTRRVDRGSGVVYDRDLVGTPWSLDDLNWGPLGHHPQGWSISDSEEAERQAYFRHAIKDGWTMLSCWDRTGDTRYGSVATFVIEGE